MSTQTTVARKCDYCALPINRNAKYVAAGVYGADFHALCWEKMGGPRVAKLLGLDEVEWATHDGTAAEPNVIGRAWLYVEPGVVQELLTKDEVHRVTHEGTPS